MLINGKCHHRCIEYSICSLSTVALKHLPSLLHLWLIRYFHSQLHARVQRWKWKVAYEVYPYRIVFANADWWYGIRLVGNQRRKGPVDYRQMLRLSGWSYTYQSKWFTFCASSTHENIRWVGWIRLRPRRLPSSCIATVVIFYNRFHGIRLIDRCKITKDLPICICLHSATPLYPRRRLAWNSSYAFSMWMT